MFELSQSMEWKRLEQTLQIGHYVPLAIPIPDELVSKQDWNNIFISLTTWIQHFLVYFFCLILQNVSFIWNTYLENLFLFYYLKKLFKRFSFKMIFIPNILLYVFGYFQPFNWHMKTINQKYCISFLLFLPKIEKN